MIGTIKTYQRPKALTACSGPATSGAGVNLKGGRGSVPAALPAGRCACPGSAAAPPARRDWGPAAPRAPFPARDPLPGQGCAGRIQPC